MSPRESAQHTRAPTCEDQRMKTSLFYLPSSGSRAEIEQNPVLLDLFVAMQTRQLRVGQLGIVLPADNPLRVAEDIAMLDHMSGGRACAGFARGYQRRWVDTLAQQLHGIHGAT